MKIVKRDLWVRPSATITLWFIPTMTYAIQKLGGMQFNDFEWLWWVTIPAMFTMWLAINFKLVKK